MCIHEALKIISSIDEFRSILAVKNETYLLVSQLPAKKVYLQFEGTLKAKPVVWNACVRTVEDYSERHDVGCDPKQFIDIQMVKHGYLLEIALNLVQIDQAVIERTIIMIRKYKQLQPGRHEYGARSKTQ